MINIHTVVDDLLKGERLSALSKKHRVEVSALRWILKKEGIDYREIMLQRRQMEYAEQFEQCLRIAREKGSVPQSDELRRMGIQRYRVGIFINQLIAQGF